MAPRRKVISTYRTPEESQPIELEINEEVFHFHSSISGLTLLEFVETFDQMDLGDDSESIDGLKLVSNAKVFTDIMFKSVVLEDQDKLHTYIRDPKNNVGIEALFDIATFLLESYTARPTESSSSSSDGSPTSGPGLTVVPASDTASTSVPPPPRN